MSTENMEEAIDWEVMIDLQQGLKQSSMINREQISVEHESDKLNSSRQTNDQHSEEEIASVKCESRLLQINMNEHDISHDNGIEQDTIVENNHEVQTCVGNEKECHLKSVSEGVNLDNIKQEVEDSSVLEDASLSKGVQEQEETPEETEGNHDLDENKDSDYHESSDTEVEEDDGEYYKTEFTVDSQCLVIAKSSRLAQFF